MREEPTRSLLLLDANPEERRLISAIAGRAGWSAVGAADEETAVALLQGPHGREVLAALHTHKPGIVRKAQFLGGAYSQGEHRQGFSRCRIVKAVQGILNAETQPSTLPAPAHFLS